jgi:hypothetical protein
MLVAKDKSYAPCKYEIPQLAGTDSIYQHHLIGTWTHGADRHHSVPPRLVRYETELAPPQHLRLLLCLWLAERQFLTVHLAPWHPHLHSRRVVLHLIACSSTSRLSQ